MVSTDLPDPVSTEFRITFDEQRFGLPLRDALLSLCERIPLVDVRLFVIALLVQKETGGKLVEILDNLAHVIRRGLESPEKCGLAPPRAALPQAS